MWKPSAISPYMAPRPRPLTRAEISSMARPPSNAPSLRDRENFVVDELRPDVVVLAHRVVHLGRERPVVGLDQALVAPDLVEALAHGIALRAAGLGDGQRAELHRVVGTGHADGRR